MEKTTSSTASATVLRSTERLWVWHHFQSDFFASKPFTRRCQPLPPALLSLPWPRLPQPSVVKKIKTKTEKIPWYCMDPSSEQWGLQPPPRHHQARLAAMLMHCDSAAWSNGHCSTKLTVHLLLAADAGESGL